MRNVSEKLSKNKDISSILTIPKIGRPSKFKTPEELEAKINEYFNNCPDTKKIYLTTYNNKGKKETTTIDVPYPTISGLALFLGFESRQSCYAYEKKDEFSYAIKKAHLLIEREYEKRLREIPAGAIFCLKNLGWKDDTTQVKVTNIVGSQLSGIIRDISNSQTRSKFADD